MHLRRRQRGPYREYIKAESTAHQLGADLAIPVSRESTGRVELPMERRGMHPRPIPPPWNEVLRACSSRELHPCAFGAHVDLVTDRLEPRQVGLTLRSGERSLDLAPAYACPCGALVLGREGSVDIDDLATTTGVATHVEVLMKAMRTLRSELAKAPDGALRTIATEIHFSLLCKLGVHVTRRNLPPTTRSADPRATSGGTSADVGARSADRACPASHAPPGDDFLSPSACPVVAWPAPPRPSAPSPAQRRRQRVGRRSPSRASRGP